jgi:predicted lipoprotein with Yx(FWY)xxD motif
MHRTMMMPLIAAIALALAACATTDEAATGPDDTSEPTAPEAVDPSADEDPDPIAGAMTIAVGVTELGEVLVDADGRTLYVFDPDAQGPSTCDDGCAASWPPVVVDAEPSAGAGVDAGLLETAPRTDGTTQATYDGWPLYRWVGDGAPGDATGQGVQDVWWVIAADGTVLRDGEAPAPASVPDDSY